MIISVIIITVLLVASYTVLVKKALNPVTLFVSPFILQYIFCRLFFSGDYQLSKKTTILFFSSLIVFSIGSFVAFIFPTKKASSDYSEVKYVNYLAKIKILMQIFFFIGVSGYLLGFYNAYRIGALNPSTFFNNIRYAVSYSADYSTNLSGYLIILLHLSILVDLLTKNTKINIFSNKQLLLGIVLLFTSVFFTMARTTLLFYTISIILSLNMNRFFYALNRKKLKKISVLLVLLFSILIIFVASVTNKLYSKNQFFIVSYIGYPLISFDRFIIDFPLNTSGSLFFAPVAKLVELLFGIKYLKLTDEMILPIGEYFNVFTVFKDLYLDFGFLGTIFCVFVIGLVSSIVFRRSMCGSIYFKLAYCVLSYSLVMSFYADQFNLSSNLYYLIAIFFIFLFEKVRIKNLVNDRRKVI
ncbi:O-antigen polymerase [Enterococcus sp. DIV1317a]|uniref:O-antigen polymerase n=1 Tax=Enterococcus sp. DIV1317a TaxID=2774818 RepID=UPI003F23414F